MGGETRPLEVHSMTDSAWYEGTVRRIGNKILVQFYGYDEDEDESFDEAILSNPAKLRLRVRRGSLQLQDSQCKSVYRGQFVCACLEVDDTRKYYDAEVKQIIPMKHRILDDGEEECLCHFTLLWREGPRKGHRTEVGCGDICLLSTKNPEDHCIIRELMYKGADEQEELQMTDSMMKGMPITSSSSSEKASMEKRKSRDFGMDGEESPPLIPSQLQASLHYQGCKKKRLSQECDKRTNVAARRNAWVEVPVHKQVKVNKRKHHQEGELTKSVTTHPSQERFKVTKRRHEADTPTHLFTKDDESETQVPEQVTSKPKPLQEKRPQEFAVVQEPRKTQAHQEGLPSELVTVGPELEPEAQNSSTYCEAVTMEKVAEVTRLIDTLVSGKDSETEDRSSNEDAVVDNYFEDQDNNGRSTANDLDMTPKVVVKTVPTLQINQSIGDDKVVVRGNSCKNFMGKSHTSGQSGQKALKVGYAGLNKKRAKSLRNSCTLCIENMELDATASDAMAMLVEITEAVTAVHVMPTLDFQVSATGYALYRDTESAQRALQILNSSDQFITSSKGRPWVVSLAPETHAPQLIGFATHTAMKGDGPGFCGVLSDQPWEQDLQVLTFLNKTAYSRALRMRDLFKQHKILQEELYQQIVEDEKKLL